MSLGPLLLLLALCLIPGWTLPGWAQVESTPSKDPADPAPDQAASEGIFFRCRTPANPRRQRSECVGLRFNAAKDTLTRNWEGSREKLREMGITTTHSYTAQFLGNPAGGLRRGSTYAGDFAYMAIVDLEKVLHLPSLSFNLGANWASGRNLSSDYIGNTFTAQSAFNGSGTLSLQQMYLQQQAFGGGLSVSLGRLAPASTFGALPVFSNYVNAALVFPASLTIDDPAFTSSPPGVEWGTEAAYYLTQKIQVSAGFFNTLPSAAAGGSNGANFAFQQGNTGVLAIVQASYFHNQAKTDTGMPGQYMIGGSYDSNSFPSLRNSGGTESPNYGFFAMFQQMVIRTGGPGSPAGLTLWGEAAISPKTSASSIPYFGGGGLSDQGLIPSRANDTASLGVVYGRFSHYIPETSDETVIELNYAISPYPWLSVTPVSQYIVKPAGNSHVQNAFVLGAQLVVTF